MQKEQGGGKHPLPPHPNKIRDRGNTRCVNQRCFCPCWYCTQRSGALLRYTKAARLPLLTVLMSLAGGTPCDTPWIVVVVLVVVVVVVVMVVVVVVVVAVAVVE